MSSPSNPSGKRNRLAAILVATLGVEPQVVTIALDMLLSGGWTISEAVVICTKTPRVQEGLCLAPGYGRLAARRSPPAAPAAWQRGLACARVRPALERGRGIDADRRRVQRPRRSGGLA